MERPIAPAIICEPAWRVQVDRFQRRHEAPAQSKPLLDQRIQVRARNHFVIDQPERLGGQRARPDSRSVNALAGMPLVELVSTLSARGSGRDTLSPFTWPGPGDVQYDTSGDPGGNARRGTNSDDEFHTSQGARR